MNVIASVFNPNFSYTYVAPERPWYEKLTFQWVNLSQLVISTHCISNARFSMDPISRGFIYGTSEGHAYGKTSASLQGRVTHLALVLFLGGIILQTPAWIGVALFSSLVATKIISNFFFIWDQPWTEYSNKIYNGIPDFTMRGSNGRVAFIEAPVVLVSESLEKWEWSKYIEDTHQIDAKDGNGRTILLRAAEDSSGFFGILSLHPNIHVTCNYKGQEMNALELMAKRGIYGAVEELVNYEHNGDSFSKEEIQKALVQTEERNRIPSGFIKNLEAYVVDYQKTIEILKKAANK